VTAAPTNQNPASPSEASDDAALKGRKIKLHMLKDADEAMKSRLEFAESKASEAEQALQTANDKLKQAELLLAISRRVAVMETVDEILETLVEITTVELQAERGSLFLNDPLTNELYSRVAMGMLRREIRVMNNAGIVGHVFQTGQGVIVDDAYNDDRFDSEIDQKTDQCRGANCHRQCQP